MLEKIIKLGVVAFVGIVVGSFAIGLLNKFDNSSLGISGFGTTTPNYQYQMPMGNMGQMPGMNYGQMPMGNMQGQMGGYGGMNMNGYGGMNMGGSNGMNMNMGGSGGMNMNMSGSGGMNMSGSGMGMGMHDNMDKMQMNMPMM